MSMPSTIGFWASLKIVSASVGLTVFGWVFKKLSVILGIGYVTYNVADWGVDKLKEAFKESYESTPQIILDLLALGGFEYGLEILFAAVSVRASFLALTNFRLMLLGNE